MSSENNRRPGKAPPTRTTADRRGARALPPGTEEPYRRLFEWTPSPMWVCDEKTRRFLAVNRAAVKLYGWSRQEFLRLTLKDILLPREEPGLRRELSRQRGSRRAFIGQCRHRTKGRAVLDVEVSMRGLMFQGRDVLLAMVRNITERKQSEEVLRRSMERFKRAEEIGHLGSWELDLPSNRLTWSDEVYRIFGLRPQQFAATYDAFLAHVHPDDRAAVDAAYSRSLREGRSAYEIEHRIVRRRTGEVRTVLEKCEHFRDATGRIVRSVGMVHDITERKRAEAALRESEQRYRTVADFTYDWEFWTNPAGRYMYVSPSCEHITGHKAEDFVRNPGLTRRLVHPDDRLRFDTHERTALVHRKPGQCEWRILRPDGTYRWVAHACQPVFDEKGQYLGVRGSNRDITERKQAESLLTDLTATLECRVAERTADLRRTNRTLRMLTECNEVLVRATDEGELLQAVCRLMVEVGGYRMAWVGFAEQDEAKSVRPVAQAGFEAGYLDMVKITWADNERGRGPTGIAIRTGKPVIARNILTHPAFGPWRQAALERGYAASATLPLKTGEQMLGALMVYAAEPGTFDSDEVELLAQLASDLAYGLSALRTRAEHRRTELARQEVHQRLENIIEFLPDATFVIDQDKRVIAWNRACEIMTGVKKEALLGQGDYAYAEPFLGERHPILIDLLYQPSPEVETFYKYVRRVGDTIYAESFISRLRSGRGAHLWGAAAPLLDQEGRRVGAIEVIRDVSEIKKAEEALRQSEQQFRLIMDNLADLVAMLDREGRRLYNSPSYASILGDPERLRGTSSFVEVHPEDRPRVEAAFQETVRTGIGQRLVYRMVDRQGRIRHIESQGSVIRDEQERVAKVVVVSRDVTDRKRAEEELHRLSAHLLQVQDLERRHLARELHDTTAQHLAALTLNLTTLRGTNPPLPQAAQTLCADCLQLAHQAAQEIRTHSYLLHPPLLEVMGLAGALEDYAQGFSARSGVEVSLEIAADFGRLPEDTELALFRVVQESLANVLKHSGSRRAIIRLTRQPSGVTLEVQDMGHGIPADKLARLKALSGGSGVGLGGMHERLRLLGGRLDLQSGPGGTTVRATVPLAEANRE